MVSCFICIYKYQNMTSEVLIGLYFLRVKRVDYYRVDVMKYCLDCCAN